MHDQAPRLQLFVADGSVLPKEQVVPAFHVPNAAAYSMESDKEVDINKVLQTFFYQVRLFEKNQNILRSVICRLMYS